MTLCSLSTLSSFVLRSSNSNNGDFSSRTHPGRDRFAVRLSTHSNPKLLKSNRRSRFGQALSPYDSEEEDDSEDDEEEEEEDECDGDLFVDDWFVDDGEFAETAVLRTKKKKPKSKKGIEKSVLVGKAINGINGINGKHTVEKSLIGASNESLSSLDVRRGKVNIRRAFEEKYPRLLEEIKIDQRWFPLIDYLSTFGLKESHFIQIHERHSSSFQINVHSAKERLEYLLSVGVKQRDVKKILLRQPQILEYTVENNLKSHVAFLRSLGIPSSRIGQIIAAAPSLFSYSVENSLKPTARYLVEEVGIKEKDLGKVVQLSPQILVQRIDVSWNTRYLFLSKEIGAPRDNIVKMVRKHPQLLHYSIDDGLLPRINFLRSIGMRNDDILKVITSLTQVLSLSLEDNLKPKYLYLINELNNEVKMLTKYPMYLSLSLDQRIRPRHKFLVSLKKAPEGPFPLSSLVPTDECFCQQWAGTSVDKYFAFRQRLQLQELENKYGRK